MSAVPGCCRSPGRGVPALPFGVSCREVQSCTASPGCPCPSVRPCCSGSSSCPASLLAGASILCLPQAVLAPGEISSPSPTPTPRLPISQNRPQTGPGCLCHPHPLPDLLHAAGSAPVPQTGSASALAEGQARRESVGNIAPRGGFSILMPELPGGRRRQITFAKRPGGRLGSHGPLRTSHRGSKGPAPLLGAASPAERCRSLPAPACLLEK